MFGRRIKASSDPADLPRNRRTIWAVGSSALTLLTIGAAGYVLVVGLPTRGDAAATTVRGIGAVGLLVALVFAALYGIWRFRLECLARRPGPILVVPIVDRTGSGETRDSALARRLTGDFQRRLADTRLYRSTAIPTSGTSSEFLDVVEQVGAFTGFWHPVMRLLQLLCPVTAYQVRCELLPPFAGGKPDAAVVQIDLLRLPSSSIAPGLIEEDTWERAIEHAAHRVAGAILPRTRQCITPPWTMWDGLRLPRPLFDLVQRFHAEHAHRRFDDAQATLREALRLDPGNLALRLELGKLQEKMAMYLDALLTYDDIIGLASRTDRDLSRWWNPPSENLEPWTDEGRAPGLRASHPIVHIARYRHALLLGLGDKLAAQWWDRPLGCPTGEHRGARERRRDDLRRILSARLAGRYRAVDDLLRSEGLVTPPLSRYLAPVRDGFTGGERTSAALDSRLFFTSVGVMELERLVRERRPRRTRVRLRAQRGLLSPRSIEVALLWACLRRAMAVVHARTREPGRPSAEYRATESVLDGGRGQAIPAAAGMLTHGWPAQPAAVESVVRGILSSPGGLLRSWYEHYNAACVFALLLLPADPFHAAETTDDATSVVADRAAELAVDELTRAVACSDSGYLAQQREWILTEDPDLDHLRSRLEFRDFEALTFGSVGLAAQRGPRVSIWQQTAHVAEFISTSAHQMAELWSRRERALSEEVPEPRVLRRWLAAERDGWRLAEVIAVDHRDWSTRHSIGQQIDVWAAEAHIDLSRRPHPDYSVGLLARQLSSMDGEVLVRPLLPDVAQGRTIAAYITEAMVASDARLELLADEVRAADPPDVQICCGRQRPLALAAEWLRFDDALRSDSSGTDARLVERWCVVSRARWQALSLWFDDDRLAAGSLDERRVQFRETVADDPFTSS